jgi:hypothetical protein
MLGARSAGQVEMSCPPPLRDKTMHVAQVEIYSDATNQAVLRHPGRRFPGVLIQGDTLSSLCYKADALCASCRSQLDPEMYGELNQLRNALWGFLTHYKFVLGEHSIPLPFSDPATQ